MPDLAKIIEAAIWDGLRSEEIAARLRPVVDAMTEIFGEPPGYGDGND